MPSSIPFDYKHTVLVISLSGAWVEDLVLRAEQLVVWTSDPTSIPAVVSLNYLFSPQSFLTAILQVTAQKNKLVQPLHLHVSSYLLHLSLTSYYSFTPFTSTSNFCRTFMKLYIPSFTHYHLQYQICCFYACEQELDKLAIQTDVTRKTVEQVETRARDGAFITGQSNLNSVQC